MSENMRSDFLNWYSKQDQYGAAHKEELWRAWQASRAALVVELPTAVCINISEHRILKEDDVIDSLDAAGVSYK